MLSVAERPVARCPNLSLIFYASEEGPYVENEIAVVFDEEPSLKELDFALVLEPTDNLLELGCGGTIHAKFTFKGHSAHSARPWQGDNAIYKAIGVLERLRTLCPTSRVVDGLEWVKTMSATMASGGRAPNVICDHFELNINARFAPDQTTTDIEREFLELARDTAQVEIVDVSPPALPRRDHPFIRLLEETGKLTVAPKLGWTDVSRLSALGIPAANFGPGSMSQAHQRNEYTSIEALHRGEAILRKWLSALPATS
jgi:succinyl-diaminopimelate desuccinylase